VHATSLQNMQHFISKWVSTVIENGVEGQKINVLDVGGADYNGSYRQLLPSEFFNYLVCDIETSQGVDLLMAEVNLIPVKSESFNLVISGQTFEHCPKFWELFSEMSRVCKSDGIIVVIAPSAGPEHKFPSDNYRFYPGAYEFLASENQLELLDLYWDSRGAWKDLVGVFSKEKKTRIDFKTGNTLLRHSTVSSDYIPEECQSKGKREYLEVLGQIHRIRNPRGYLEIGVRDGNSLELSTCPAVAIDPTPGNFVAREKLDVFELTSNQFFRELNIKDYLQYIDLAFIDGLHLFENVYQDFMNIEAHMEPSGMIILDDIYPNTQLQGARDRQTTFWMGDVWKFWTRLQVLRPDLVFVEVDTSPSGLGIVLNLDPTSSVLAENFNGEVRSAQSDTSPIPSNILDRQKSMDPTDKNLRRFLTHGTTRIDKFNHKVSWQSLLFRND
jgi:Methyltransferase domain